MVNFSLYCSYYYWLRFYVAQAFHILLDSYYNVIFCNLLFLINRMSNFILITAIALIVPSMMLYEWIKKRFAE